MTPHRFWKRLHELKERLLPRPFERVALAGRRDLVGAEVGVFEGEHARTILRTAGVRQLFLVDPYRPYSDYGYDQVFSAFSRARRKLRRWEGRTRWILMPSEDAAAHVPDGLDFVYIDGDHSYEAVRSDLRTWWPKVRAGGVLGGHDMSDTPGSEHPGVVKAVFEFAQAGKHRLRIEMSDWWIDK